MYSRFLRSYLPVICALAACLCSCGRDGGGISPEVASIIADTAEMNPYAVLPPPAPDSGCQRMRIRPVGSFGRVFNDSNHVHLAQARALGIAPIADDADAWYLGRGLVKVESNSWYLVDELKHSYPYLVPRARQVLDEIGRRFRDSLQARGGGQYRLKVTSVLRTPLTVGKLRRVNRNASGESAHQYATTFDISYSKFICDDSTATRRRFEDLKNLLAEVVDAMRKEGSILVKHERRQACFHITAAATDYSYPIDEQQ